MPYTPQQVTEMLSIPASSLRRLASEFEGFLSPQQGRRRSYTERDINVLRQVREMTGRGMTLEAIKIALPVVEAPPVKDDSLALIPSLGAELVSLDTKYQTVSRQFDQLQAAWANDHEALARLESAAQADRERLARLEAWASLPWWRRLFTPPPK